MDLKLVHTAVDAYAKGASRSDNARLRFFEGLFDIQQQRADLVAASDGYEVPAAPEAFELYRDNAPVFSKAPVTLDAAEFQKTCELLAAYLASEAGLADEAAQALAAYDWSMFVEHADLALAGSDPALFIERMLQSISELDVPDDLPANVFMMVPAFALRAHLQPAAELVAKAARKAGCAVLDRVVTADLLTNGGTVCGAAGFDIRTGDFHIIRAGAVIISTGGTNRLYSNPSGMSFNTWMCPADTGDGEAMSLRAGAELANIINEAALRAVRDGRRFVTQSDLEESIEVVVAGYQKKNAILTDKEKRVVAYHEVGHALVAAKQTNSAPVQKITIVPRTSGALGYTMQVEEGNHYLISREELENKIATLTGGRAAEELIFNSESTGAANDIEQATKLARAMITRYGMSDDFDMVALETVNNQYLGGDTSLACSAETQTQIDKQVVSLVKSQHEKALGILKENRAKLDEIAAYLYDKETITGEEFMRILNA